jgi:hypothetical protein|uniref:Uncharacterized protein n=1 Tax=Populus alba TaxID=43335 RepID=A0A451FPJ1_POPAL|nr:hypothetical protein [Populus alba]QAA78971.1 hypothetical protein [Populus alba]UZA65974.1 hypothetical protein Potri.00MG000010 [Populus trichocarpa]UZA66025.1 hypothetical protein Podel.00MG000010 [Populus deltoides]
MLGLVGSSEPLVRELDWLRVKFTVVEKRSIRWNRYRNGSHSTWEFRLWLVGLANDASFLSSFGKRTSSPCHDRALKLNAICDRTITVPMNLPFRCRPSSSCIDFHCKLSLSIKLWLTSDRTLIYSLPHNQALRVFVLKTVPSSHLSSEKDLVSSLPGKPKPSLFQSFLGHQSR